MSYEMTAGSGVGLYFETSSHFIMIFSYALFKSTTVASFSVVGASMRIGGVFTGAKQLLLPSEKSLAGP